MFQVPLDLICPELTRPNWTSTTWICSDLTWPVFTWPLTTDLSCPYSTSQDLTYLNLTCPYLTSQWLPNTSRHSSDTLNTSTRHPSNFFWIRSFFWTQQFWDQDFNWPQNSSNTWMCIQFFVVIKASGKPSNMEIKSGILLPQVSRQRVCPILPHQA